MRQKTRVERENGRAAADGLLRGSTSTLQRICVRKARAVRGRGARPRVHVHSVGMEEGTRSDGGGHML